ncbi:hypothetical protein [Labrys monachus]|uniref:Uncharacterized protein n=1 Tax=Labrys monachus TaxID=217067 RepID=A0ABU0FJN9_9HYPH|nr:hypothetical protein [Labrys monachus]MDQ0394562.1 hypothetical protein [Labrys monachus]
MFFIFRMIFWMIVVMLVLPSPRTTSDRREELSVHALASQAAAAATSYCVANAQTCMAGLETVRSLAAPPDKAVQRDARPRDGAPSPAIALPPPRPVIP